MRIRNRSRARVALAAVAAAGAALVFSTAGAFAQARTAESRDYRLSVEQVAGGLAHPWGIAFLPDGGWLVTERPGRLNLFTPEGRKITVSGTPRAAASGQGGLLDVALDPDFAANGLVYLSFSEPGDGGSGTAVARGRLVREGGAARLDGVTTIFRQRPKVGTTRHYGSRLVFDRAGNLFVTLGDRGNAEEAQNPQSHIGTLVRIRPDGSVPPDNPHPGGGEWLPEIFSIGHRNIQGADLDPRSGRLWTVEHGARGGDEINLPRPGRNYGWPTISYGRHYSGGRIGVGTSAPGMEQPVYYWDPSIAPSGLAVYDGAMFPAWRGDLFVGALAGQMLVRLDVEGRAIAGEERLLQGTPGRIRDVEVAPDGALWLLTDAADGGIWRVGREGAD